jgi:hypothetical protein
MGFWAGLTEAFDPATEARQSGCWPFFCNARQATPGRQREPCGATHAALSACWTLDEGKAITVQLACLPLLLSAYDLA